VAPKGITAAPHVDRTAFCVAHISAALARTERRSIRGSGDMRSRVGAGETTGDELMKYAILCYHDEAVTCAWSKEHDDAVMERLAVVHGRIAASGKLGPVARLLPTSAATTVRGDREPGLVLDGPFAETKEQLLGFYVVDCDDLEEAIAFARELGQANPGGAYEVRPIGLYKPGTAPG
jgi:hypothetical protein